MLPWQMLVRKLCVRGGGVWGGNMVSELETSILPVPHTVLGIVNIVTIGEHTNIWG